MSPLVKPMAFVLAGNAVFTLLSRKTQDRFTFRVRQSQDNATMHFVQVLTGPNNTEDYRYLGFMRRGVYFHGGAKAKIGPDAPSAKAFDWFWRNLSKGVEMPSLEFYHCGRCGRCARPLTVPQSIETGFGPECIGKVCL